MKRDEEEAGLKRGAWANIEKANNHLIAAHRNLSWSEEVLANFEMDQSDLIFDVQGSLRLAQGALERAIEEAKKNESALNLDVNDDE